MFEADCIQTSYKVPAFERELLSAAADIHDSAELGVELARRMCRTYVFTASRMNNKQLQ